MALLMTARYGLTDSELMDILSYDVLFHSDSSQGTVNGRKQVHEHRNRKYSFYV